MDLDMVADKEVDKLADMVVGHGCWLIDPNLNTRLVFLLSFASLFNSCYFDYIILELGLEMLKLGLIMDLKS